MSHSVLEVQRAQCDAGKAVRKSSRDSFQSLENAGNLSYNNEERTDQGQCP